MNLHSICHSNRGTSYTLLLESDGENVSAVVKRIHLTCSIRKDTGKKLIKCSFDIFYRIFISGNMKTHNLWYLSKIELVVGSGLLCNNNAIHSWYMPVIGLPIDQCDPYGPFLICTQFTREFRNMFGLLISYYSPWFSVKCCYPPES